MPLKFDQIQTLRNKAMKLFGVDQVTDEAGNPTPRFELVMYVPKVAPEDGIPDLVPWVDVDGHLSYTKADGVNLKFYMPGVSDVALTDMVMTSVQGKTPTSSTAEFYAYRRRCRLPSEPSLTQNDMAFHVKDGIVTVFFKDSEKLFEGIGGAPDCMIPSRDP